MHQADNNITLLVKRRPGPLSLGIFRRFPMLMTTLIFGFLLAGLSIFDLPTFAAKCPVPKFEPTGCTQEHENNEVTTPEQTDQPESKKMTPQTETSHSEFSLEELACRRFFETRGEDVNGMWSWHHYANPDSETRTLVAGHSGSSGDYAKMLDMTSRANHAYARKWGYDYAEFRGIGFGCLKHHAAYNKIEVLRTAMDKGYNKVLLLDADALVYDFNMPLNQTILPKEHVIAGHYVKRAPGVPNPVRNINNGVMVWHLKKKYAKLVLDRWREISLPKTTEPSKLVDRGIFTIMQDDQKNLHDALAQFSDEEQKIIVWNTTKIFAYDSGTFVRHYIRRTKQTNLRWDDATLMQDRLKRIQTCVDNVCQKFQACAGL